MITKPNTSADKENNLASTALQSTELDTLTTPRKKRRHTVTLRTEEDFLAYALQMASATPSKADKPTGQSR